MLDDLIDALSGWEPAAFVVLQATAVGAAVGALVALLVAVAG